MTAAIALKATRERTIILTRKIIPFLHREMAGKSSTDTAQLQSIANEVGEILKEKIGMEQYSEMLIECSKKNLEKKVRRKEELSNLLVTNPEAAQEIKKMKTKKKADSRKRKLDIQKPYRVTKRRNREVIREKMEDEEADFFDK